MNVATERAQADAVMAAALEIIPVMERHFGPFGEDAPAMALDLCSQLIGAQLEAMRIPDAVRTTMLEATLHHIAEIVAERRVKHGH